MKSFRQFKERFTAAVASCEDAAARLQEAMAALEPLPPAYPHGGQPQELLDIEKNLQLIQDSFSDLDDDVDVERQKFSKQARKGQFSAIQDVHERLLSPIQRN